LKITQFKDELVFFREIQQILIEGFNYWNKKLEELKSALQTLENLKKIIKNCEIKD